MKLPSLRDKRLAEFVGILLGDGSIGIYRCKNGNRTTTQYRVKISLNSKDELIYASFIENLLEKLFGIRPFRSIRKNENTLDLLIFGRTFVNFLMNVIGLSLSPKKDNAIIPKFYMRNKLELSILRGYFDTDGCVAIVNNNGTLYPRLEMKICRSPMQSQFIEILERNNFRFGAYVIDNDNIRVQLNGLKELKKWNELVGFSNSKNSERYRKMVARVGFS